MGGNAACTDGQSIWLPDVEHIETLGRNEILGYLIHECGHVRFTDMETKGDTVLQHQLINAIEDVRIEREMAKIYGGAQALLYGVHAPILDDLAKAVDKTPIASCLGLYLSIKGAELIGNYHRPELASQLRGRLMKDLGKASVDDIDTCLQDVPSMQSTSDAKAIVDRILKLLEDAEQKQGASHSSNAGDEGTCRVGNPTGTSPSSAADSSASVNDETATGPSGEQASHSSDLKDGDEHQGASNGGSSESSASKDQGTREGASANEAGNSQGSSSSQAGKGDHSHIQTILGATEKDLKALKKLDISSTFPKVINKEVRQHKRVGVSTLKPVKASPLGSSDDVGTRLHPGRLQQAKADSTYARRALQGLVQARTRASTRTASTGMKLSSTNMSRLATWNLRVFDKRTEHKAVNTAVHILLDMSGSMRQSEETAIRASLALTACLTTFSHVNPALSVFPGRQHEVMAVLRHGQRMLAKSEKCIAGLSARGGTPLSEALLTGGIALAQTREDRKVMIVVTDGVPDDVASAQMLIKKLRESGVLLIGIGIGEGHCVDQLFEHCVSIEKVEDLQSKFFAIARELFV